MLLLGKFDYTERGILDKDPSAFLYAQNRTAAARGERVSDPRREGNSDAYRAGVRAEREEYIDAHGNRVLAFCTWLLPGCLAIRSCL